MTIPVAGADGVKSTPQVAVFDVLGDSVQEVAEKTPGEEAVKLTEPLGWWVEFWALSATKTRMPTCWPGVVEQVFTQTGWVEVGSLLVCDQTVAVPELAACTESPG